VLKIVVKSVGERNSTC